MNSKQKFYQKITELTAAQLINKSLNRSIDNSV